MKDLNSSYFLPHRYKRIGWGIIGIPLLIVVFLGLRAYLGLQTPESLVHFIFSSSHITLMLGLTIVISSREEKEDEMIRMIRLKAFQYGLYLTVFVSLVLFFAGYPGLQTSQLIIDVGGINFTLIYIVIIYQFKLSRLKNDEE